MMYIVISYDIIDDKRRSRLAKMLLNYGRRVQKSVFECLLEDRELLELKGKIPLIIDQKTDSVRFYQVCARCVNAIEILGWGTVSEDEDIIIV